MITFIDEKELVSLTSDTTLARWNLTKGSRLWSVDVDLPNGSSFAFTKGDDSFLVPGQAGVLYQIKDGKKIRQHGERAPLDTELITQSLTGKTAAVSQRVLDAIDAEDKPTWQIVIFDPQKPGTMQRAILKREKVLSMAFSHDEKLLASAGNDKAISVWDIARRMVHKRLDVKNPAICLSFSPCGRFLAYSDGESTALLGATTLNLVKSWNTESGGGGYFAFSPDGKYIALGGHRENGYVTGLWNLENEKNIPVTQEFKGHKGTVRSVAFSPNGKKLATGGDDGKINVWSIGNK
jgi:WD40 repeat protein